MRAVLSLLAAGCLATGVSTFTTAAQAPDLSQQGIQPPEKARSASPTGAGDTQVQTIRVEALEGRVRLRLEGPEIWTIDANAFDVIALAPGIQFRAQPAGIDVRTPRTDSIANEFALTVSSEGKLGFHIRNMRRRTP
jgi:hypothetical protein